MSIYAKVEGNTVIKYPYGLIDLKNDNPNVSFTSDALSKEENHSSFGVAEVIEVEKPIKAGWKTVEETPTLSNGVWSQNWNHSAKSMDELVDGDILRVDAPDGAWLKENGKNAREDDPELIDGVWTQKWITEDRTWIENRVAFYETADQQIEFITENGLEAWQARVADIKARYPKP